MTNKKAHGQSVRGLSTLVLVPTLWLGTSESPLCGAGRSGRKIRDAERRSAAFPTQSVGLYLALQGRLCQPRAQSWVGKSTFAKPCKGNSSRRPCRAFVMGPTPTQGCALG